MSRQYRRSASPHLHNALLRTPPKSLQTPVSSRPERRYNGYGARPNISARTVLRGGLPVRYEGGYSDDSDESPTLPLSESSEDVLQLRREDSTGCSSTERSQSSRSIGTPPTGSENKRKVQNSGRLLLRYLFAQKSTCEKLLQGTRSDDAQLVLNSGRCTEDLCSRSEERVRRDGSTQPRKLAAGSLRCENANAQELSIVSQARRLTRSSMTDETSDPELGGVEPDVLGARRMDWRRANDSLMRVLDKLAQSSSEESAGSRSHSETQDGSRDEGALHSEAPPRFYGENSAGSSRPAILNSTPQQNAREIGQFKSELGSVFNRSYSHSPPHTDK